jgi:Holliday junction resolvase RusA-like endonuclease
MIEILVYEVPAPQGSKSAKGHDKAGHAILVESSKKLPSWREAVKYAALQNGRPQVTGACRVDIVFTLPKPKSAPKKRTTYPDRKPDGDKLERGTLDALVAVGTIEDDARVVKMTWSKVYPGEGVRSLPSPGAVIRIWDIQEQQGVA